MAAAVKKSRRKPPPAPGPGRPKGSKNKVPAELKKALQMALDGFATEIPSLLQQVAKKDPARALELVARLGEYVVPKLGRTEHTVGRTTLEELVAGADARAAEGLTVGLQEAVASGRLVRQADGTLRSAGLIRALEAQEAERGSYAVPLDRNLPDSPPAPAPVPRPAPVLIAESESPAEPRASDQEPALPDLPREGLAEGERTVADLRAKARRPLFNPDYDPYR